MSAQSMSINASSVANPLPKIVPHAVKAGGFVFVSGSIALDAKGKMVEGGIKEHTHQVIKNLTNVLKEVGSGRHKIVKINVFLSDLDDFDAMNEVYSQYFQKPNLPARTCAVVFTMPMYADIQMECTALA